MHVHWQEWPYRQLTAAHLAPGDTPKDGEEHPRDRFIRHDGDFFLAGDR
jgi:hypothetical protein